MINVPNTSYIYSPYPTFDFVLSYLVKFKQFLSPSYLCISRVPGGAAGAMRQQINQQIGQAVTNAAMNELSNVFASKFK